MTTRPSVGRAVARIPVGRGVQKRLEFRRELLAARQVAREHAESIDVVGGRWRFAGELLRARCTFRPAASDLECVLFSIENTGNPEIEKPRLSRRVDQDVRGFEIAVHDPLSVRIVEGIGDGDERRKNVL